MSGEEVSAWLTANGFERLVNSFLEQNVDGDVLLSLTLLAGVELGALWCQAWMALGRNPRPPAEAGGVEGGVQDEPGRSQEVARQDPGLEGDRSSHKPRVEANSK